MSGTDQQEGKLDYMVLDFESYEQYVISEDEKTDVQSKCCNQDEDCFNKLCDDLCLEAVALREESKYG
eukprot:1561688-Karenia_brevis.AAC.1